MRPDSKQEGHYGLTSSWKARAFSVLAALLCCGLLSGSLVAASNVSETFLSKEPLPRGTVVTLDPSNENTVTPATVSFNSQVLGVVSEPPESAITIDNKVAGQSITLSGDATVLMSNLNGDVQQGDTVSVSWIDGVAMRQTQQQYAPVGTALENFNTTTAKEYEEVDTPSGKKTPLVNAMRVRLHDRSEGSFQDENRGIEAAFSQALGKQVSLLKIVSASAVFVCGLIIAGSFVSSSLHSSFISIGRNPMAAGSIQRGMVRVAALSTLVVIIGTTLAYVVIVI